MKTTTMALAFSAAALFMGCGGSSSSSDTSDTSSSSVALSSSTAQSLSSSSSSTSSSTSDQPQQASTLTVNDVNAVNGYTIKTNQSTLTFGAYTMHQTITLSIGCDGSFQYTIKDEGSGTTVTDTGSGTSVVLDTSFDPYELSWYGTWNGDGVMEAGESIGDSLTLSNTNQIIAGSTCWMDLGEGTSGADCPNNLYIETITRDTVCN